MAGVQRVTAAAAFRSVLPSAARSPRVVRAHARHGSSASGSNSADGNFLKWCEEQTTRMKHAGTYAPPESAVLASIKPPYVVFTDYPHRLVNFSSYDYLGLAEDRDLIMAYNRGLVEQASSGTVRQADGVREWTLHLENIIASFHNREACFSFASFSEALAGFFHTAYGPNDIIFSDEYNSIPPKGPAERCSYNHLDLNDLEQKLKSTRCKGKKVIVTDGVFSQTGEITPISDVLDVAALAGAGGGAAGVVVCDSHGVGVLGGGLRGSTAADQLGADDSLVLAVDFSFGLGQLVGGYITCSSKALLDNVSEMTSLPFDTVDLSAASTAALAAMFYKLPTLSSKASELRSVSMQLRQNLRGLGLQVKGHDHPIVSFRVGKEKTCRMLVQQLRDAGHVVSAITHPLVRPGDAHVRIILTAAHEDAHVDALFASVQTLVDRLKITRQT